MSALPEPGARRRGTSRRFAHPEHAQPILPRGYVRPLAYPVEERLVVGNAHGRLRHFRHGPPRVMARHVARDVMPGHHERFARARPPHVERNQGPVDLRLEPRRAARLRPLHFVARRGAAGQPVKQPRVDLVALQTAVRGRPLVPRRRVVPVDARRDPHDVLAGQRLDQRETVRADVHERAPVGRRRRQRIVGRVALADVFDAPDTAHADQFGSGERLGKAAVHEARDQLRAVRPGRIGHRAALPHRARQRSLHEHVLAGLRRRHGDLRMGVDPGEDADEIHVVAATASR